MKEDISIKTLDNGLVVIVERMADFESIAWELHIPGGVAHDGTDSIGASLILAELTLRGAGPYDSRALSDAFDAKGIRHGEGVGHERFYYRANCLRDTLSEVTRLFSLTVREPHLPSEEVDSIRSVLMQDIDALKDNPSRRAFTELAQRYYPTPFNRPGIGTKEGLERTTISDLKAMHRSLFCPKGSILSVAGSCDVAEVMDQIEQYFGSWTGQGVGRIQFGVISSFQRHHIQEESAQLQIVLSYPSAPFGSPHYYAAKVASQILSGGMFGRLFIEVREKRGLVYSVHASHVGQKEYGTVSAYAGTTPERAHETFDVIVAELRRLKGTTTSEEIARAKANLKASLVLGQEGPGSRAGSNVSDYWVDGRVRSLEEIIAAINQVDASAIDNYLEAYPADEFTVLTLGSRDLGAQ